jgi:HD-GYP domain-containing protein (c-di-GMP phosphodiesterase class II)
LAGAFDAMTSDRPYRAAMTTAEAMEEVKGNSGSQFDPRVVKTFLEIPSAEISEMLQNKGKTSIQFV